MGAASQEREGRGETLCLDGSTQLCQLISSCGNPFGSAELPSQAPHVRLLEYPLYNGYTQHMLHTQLHSGKIALLCMS